MKRVSGVMHNLICAYCGTENPSGAAVCRTCGSSLSGAPVKPSTPSVTASSDHLKAGTFLRGGRYLIVGVLGQGGFGITYKALDTQEKRSVAVKEFFPDGSVIRSDEGNVVPRKGSVQDFERGKLAFGTEAAKLRTFKNPSIVAVHDNFVERNTAYLVMEFLDGETLEDRIASGKLLGENEARNLLYFLLEALGEVHAKGVLHLDIKPANIVLTDERPELIDFGTARRVIHGEATKVSQRVLTPAYAPLEQYATEAKLGPWTDLYALAATFYEALTGVKPPNALDRANGAKLMPIRKFSPLVRLHLSDAIENALEMQVTQRPNSTQHMVDRLRAPQARPTPSTSQQTATARPRTWTPSPQPIQASAPLSVTPTPDLPKPEGERSFMISVVFTTVCAFLVVVSIMAFMANTPSGQTVGLILVIPSLYGMLINWLILAVHRWRLHRDSARWPTVAGLIVHQAVEKHEHKGSATWSVSVTYEFTVGRQRYSSTKIGFGSTFSYFTEATADLKANQYPLGQSVTVYHRPNGPLISVLEPATNNNQWLTLLYLLLASALLVVAVVGGAGIAYFNWI